MSSPPADHSLLRHLRWRAILLGIVTDIGATGACGFVIGLVAGVVFSFRGGRPGEINDILFHTTRFLIIFEAVGLLFTVVGGSVAGRLAPQARYWNAGAVALFDLLYGGIFFNSHLPVWFNLVGFGGTLPCALLGAFLAGFFPSAPPPPPPEPPFKQT